MNFGYLSISWFAVDPKLYSELTVASTTALMQQPKSEDYFEIRPWGWTLVSVPSPARNGDDKIQVPITINKGLKERSRQREFIDPPRGGTRMRFRPYVCKVPWHTGARASFHCYFQDMAITVVQIGQVGKMVDLLFGTGGQLIGWVFDTHDQEKLLKADLAFLECLERPHIAHLYKTMCVTGLRNILIPYRRHLMKLQHGQPLIDFEWLAM